MYDAREALAPGGMFERSSGATRSGTTQTQAFREREEGRGFRHDPLTYIGPDRGASAAGQGYGNLPIPVGIFMNMAHVPPRFYNQHQQMIAQGKEGKSVLAM